MARLPQASIAEPSGPAEPPWSSRSTPTHPMPPITRQPARARIFVRRPPPHDLGYSSADVDGSSPSGLGIPSSDGSSRPSSTRPGRTSQTGNPKPRLRPASSKSRMTPTREDKIVEATEHLAPTPMQAAPRARPLTRSSGRSPSLSSAIRELAVGAQRPADFGQPFVLGQDLPLAGLGEPGVRACGISTTHRHPSVGSTGPLEEPIDTPRRSAARSAGSAGTPQHVGQAGPRQQQSSQAGPRTCSASGSRAAASEVTNSRNTMVNTRTTMTSRSNSTSASDRFLEGYLTNYHRHIEHDAERRRS